MEFIASYASDSSETELSDGSEKLKADFFSLDESEDDEKIAGSHSNDILCQAGFLSDEPYGPISEENILKEECHVDTTPLMFVKRKNERNLSSTSKERRLNNSSDLNNRKVVSSAYKVNNYQESRNGNIKTNSVSQNKKYPGDIFNNPKSTIDCVSDYKNFIPRYQIKSYQAHTSTVTALSWNLEKFSHLLLSTSSDCTLKIWSSLLSYNCVKNYKADGGVKAAKWSLSGTEIIWGGYDKKASILDVGSEKLLSIFPVKDFVSCIEIHPEAPDIFLLGTKNNIFAFDRRDKDALPIRCYSSKCQYVLDLDFMKTSMEFIASTEVVSHDCADRTLMVWDFATGAILSNQIFCECYTCPCVKVSPDEKQFVAQTNGNYIAIFSTKRPYKLKQKRFTGHEVVGYSIDCDFSQDSRLLVSGDAKGGMYFYNSYTCNLIKTIEAKPNVPMVRVNWHPSLNSTIATGFWDGTIQIWQ